jgi:hypothetical protein
MKVRILTSLAVLMLCLGAAPPSGYGPPPAQTSDRQSALPTGFKHDPRNDLNGYYIPSPDLKIGKWEVTDIALGTGDEFVAYEKGKRDPPEYAPFMIEFADTSSPQVTNELGGTNYSNQRRVLPTAYAISGNHVAFVGKDSQVGTVAFTGTLDLAAVKQAQASEGNYDATRIVLTGDLSVGGHVVKNLKFTWFGGD